MEEIICVYLDSKKSTSYINNQYEFRVSPNIVLKNDEYCEFYLQNFSCINGIPNIITGENDTLTFTIGSGSAVSISIEKGYYSGAGLVTAIQTLLTAGSIPLNAVWDNINLKMKISHTNTAFTITETNLSQMLNFEPREYTSTDSFICQSSEVVDLNENVHNLYFTVTELTTNTRTSNSFVAVNAIAKIPIVSAFGSYNIFQANNPIQKFVLKQSSVNNLTIKLLTDVADTYHPGRWTATLCFTIKKLPLNKIEDEDTLKILKSFRPNTQDSFTPFPPSNKHNIKSRKDIQIGAIRQNPYWI